MKYIKRCRQQIRDQIKQVKLGFQGENLLDIGLLPKFWRDLGSAANKVMKWLQVYWHES